MKEAIERRYRCGHAPVAERGRHGQAVRVIRHNDGDRCFHVSDHRASIYEARQLDPAIAHTHDAANIAARKHSSIGGERDKIGYDWLDHRAQARRIENIQLRTHITRASLCDSYTRNDTRSGCQKRRRTRAIAFLIDDLRNWADIASASIDEIIAYDVLVAGRR